MTMIARDGEIKLIGPEKTIGQAKSVFNNLIQLSMRGNTITEQNVDYALSLPLRKMMTRSWRSIRTLSAVPLWESR